MIFDPAPGNGGMAQMGSPQKRTFSLRRRKPDANQIGLLPTEGWRKRNLQFINDVLIPSILAPRRPGRVCEGVPEARATEIGVTWLGHAGFLAQINGTNILIDPNWALWHGPIKRLRHPSLWAGDLPRIDLVMVSHAHYDHLHLPSLRRIAHGQPVIVPKGVGNLVDRCGFGRVTELSTWQTVTYRDLRITLTPARHWGARMIHDTHRHFGGFLIQSPDRCLFHCGDSAMFDGFAEIGRRAQIDVALMPIGAYNAPSGRPVHMNPEEAVDAFEMMEAINMVPMHHGTFPLGGEPVDEPAERLAQAMVDRRLESRIRIVHEGESVLY